MPEIRDAVPADAEGIGEAHAEAWRVGYAGQFPPDALAAAVAARRTRWTRDAVTDGGADGDVLLVAGDDQGVAGFAHGVPGELAGLYVHPRAWGTGVADRLVEALLARMPGPDVHLWALAGAARARRFYERTGWSATGRERDHEFGPGLTGRVVEYARRLP